MSEDKPFLVTGVAQAPEIFIDGYHGAAFSNGVVKLNCYSATMDPESGGQLYLCPMRLAMSVPTLVQVRDAFTDLIRRLENDGVIVSVGKEDSLDA